MSFSPELAEELEVIATRHPHIVREETEAFRAALERGAQAWKLPVPGVVFAAHLADRWEPTSGAAGIAQLFAEDLYLAAGCAAQVQPALKAFEHEFSTDIRAAARRADAPGLDAEELKQRVMSSLFLTSGARRAKIDDYAGRGPLRAWLRVVVTRLVLDHVRKRSGHEPTAEEPERMLVALGDRSDDPELIYLKRLYSVEFAQALTEALASLATEHRNALRHRYVEALSIDQIAIAHGVHRATAARRVQKAEQELFAEARRRLSERLRLSNRELASVLRLVQSEMHVSVARLLGA